MYSQVGKFIQLFTTFLGGFVIALIKGWLLSLVLMASIPPMVVSGALMTIAVSKMASLGQAAYAQAGVAVEEIIGSIRTVCNFPNFRLPSKIGIHVALNA